MEHEQVDLLEREPGPNHDGCDVLLAEPNRPLEDGPTVHLHELLTMGETLGCNRSARATHRAGEQSGSTAI